MAALDADVIADITALNPALKAILMIRNPIDRAWSHAKKDLIRNRKRRFEEVSEAEFRAFFSDPYQLRCARYAEQCDRWSAHLQSGHLFVGVFDDIATRPEALLLDVMRFLASRPSAVTSIAPCAARSIPPSRERCRRTTAACWKRSSPTTCRN